MLAETVTGGGGAFRFEEEGRALGCGGGMLETEEAVLEAIDLEEVDLEEL